MRRPGLLGIIYLVVGLLVAGGVIGNEPNLFDGIGSISDVIELILVIVLWPIVLLGVDINIGGGGSGGGTGGGSGAGSGGGGG